MFQLFGLIFKGKKKNIAEKYDFSSKKRYQYYAPEVIFGLINEYIKKGQKILDVGIGTGLSAELFYRAGLRVYGMDISEEMMAGCKKKKITEELKVYDINNSDWPYRRNQFHHLISCGVFHFFKDLDKVFEEVNRVLKKKGYFAFTVQHSKDKEIKATDRHKDYVVYAHSPQYIEKIARKFNFKKHKECHFIGIKNRITGEKIEYVAYILSRRKD